MKSLFFSLLLIPYLNINAAAGVRSRWIMGTLLEITAADGSDAAFAEVERLDRVLSTFKYDSEASRLNRSAGKGPVPVSEDLWHVLRISSSVWAESGGAFDPTYASSPLSRGFGRILLDAQRRCVSLPSGARLDFGGIGKGYALDAAAAVLRKRGVVSAFMNFGGQAYALGSWPITVSGEIIDLRDASASSSSDAERPGHIINPASGLPLRHAGSVTVILPSAAQADAWSTALYVAGPRALPFDFPGCALPERTENCPRRLQ